MKELGRAQGTCCNNDLGNYDFLFLGKYLVALYKCELVSGSYLLDVYHLGKRHNLGTEFFGKVEVVFHEGVFSPMPTTSHALTAVDAAGSCRSRAAKIRIGCGFSFFAEVDTKRSHLEGVSKTQAVAGFLQSLICWREILV